MKKWLLRLMMLGGVLLVVLMISGYVVRKQWGQDESSFKFSSADPKFLNYDFAAKRDSMGVWHLQVSSAERLAFAFGYVHAHDREFQTEMIRRAATGRLSSVFGAVMLARDRMLRFFVYPAKDEYMRMQKEDPELARGLDAYVLGRRAFLENTKLPLPVEYRIFGLTRAEVADWEPWELLAISRLHAWQFSSDYRSEVLRAQLKEFLGEQVSYLFSPSEPVTSPALYDQVLVKDFSHSRYLAKAISIEDVYKQTNGSGPDALKLLKGYTSKSASLGPLPRFQDDEWERSMVFSKVGRASNSWILQDPRVGRPLTLCNDTHLEFSFPSQLYPVVYTLEGADKTQTITGKGYSLPGVPYLLIGQLEKKLKAQNRAQTRVFGITIADFADSEDLVKISDETLQKAKVYEAEFVVRDPLTQKKEVKKFPVQWTSFGPRVDEIIDWGVLSKPKKVALDWLGFRRARTPLGFFMRQNLFTGESVKLDLLKHWDLPSVNLDFIESDVDGVQSAGHVVTGLIYTDRSLKDRAERREFSTEKQASQRIILGPADRPHFEVTPSAKKTFYLVSANQRIWSGDLGFRTGFEWTNANRAQTIVEDFEKNVITPEYSQTNFYSRNILNFVKKAREKVRADQLCDTQELELSTSCLELLAKLDSWDGVADANGWQTTVAYLWRSLFRKKLFMPNVAPKLAVLEKKPEQADAKEEPRDEALNLFKAWDASNMSDRSVLALMNDEAVAARFEQVSSKKINNLLTESFGEALGLLSDRFGPIVATWRWGAVHAIAWGHPFTKIPGALGPLLRDSMLGEPPEVSGTDESPGSTAPHWDSLLPTEMPATHGAVMRFCSEIDPEGRASMRWANVTGTSGNPFSEWAWKFAKESWFKNVLLPVEKN